ncbi:MAG: metal ABC transporter permease [Candidatus Gracilibacteria bacterium]|jgi:zinc transport system permease protein
MFDFFEYSFMTRALVAGLLVGASAPLLGTFLVARRSSMLTDTLSHTALAGVGVGMVAGVSPLLGALFVSILAATGIEKIVARGRLGTEAVHALFLSGGLALAVALISLSHSTLSFESYLFGSISTVSTQDLVLLSLLAVGSFVGIGLFWWPLVTLAFNEELAEASGLRVQFFKTGLGILAALTVSLSLKIIGGLLIGALMVIPVLAALQMANSFRSTAVLAILFAEAAVLIGLILSYISSVPSGSSIVLVCIVGFFISLILKPVIK